MLIGMGMAINGVLATPHASQTVSSLRITPFSRDRTLFDGGLMRGKNTAAVPLSGSTAALNGATIEARAVSLDDGGATSTDWRDIASVDDGRWSGVLDTPISASWYKPEVRIKGETAAIQGAQRFGVGLILFAEEQSLLQQNLMPYFHRASHLVSVPDPEAVQLIMAENRGLPTEPDTGTVAPIRHLNDAAQAEPWYTSSMSQMARTICLNAPGLKTLLVFDVKEGTDELQPLIDNDPVRRFEVTQAIADAVHADGAQVGLIHVTHDRKSIARSEQSYLRHTLPAIYFEKASDGSALPPITPTSPYSVVLDDTTEPDTVHGSLLQHSYARAYPEFRELTALVQSQSMSSSANTAKTYRANNVREDIGDGGIFDENWAPDGAGMWPRYVYSQQAIQSSDFLTTRMRWGCLHNIVQHNASDIAHHDPEESYVGMPEYARARMIVWMQAAGVIDIVSPVLDRVEWATDGSYVDVWSSAGPITTKKRLHDVVPDLSPDHPFAQCDVLNFQYNGPNGQEYFTRTQIVDADGTPASEGRVRLFPQSGDQFTGLTRIYYWADSGFGAQTAHQMIADHLQHWKPIVRQGLQGFDGLMLQPNSDVEFINQANPLGIPVGGDLLTHIDGSQAYDTPNLSGSQLTLDMAIFKQLNTGSWDIVRTSGGGSFFYQVYMSATNGGFVFKFTNNAGCSFNGRVNFRTDLLTPANGVVPRFRVVADLKAGYVRLFFTSPGDPNEVEITSESPEITAAIDDPFGRDAAGISGAGGSFHGGVGLRLLEASGYDVAYIRAWPLVASDGSVPQSAPWFEVKSDGNDGFEATGVTKL